MWSMHSCREGSGWVYKMLKDMISGRARPDAVDQLYDVAKKIEGRTICAFGEAISWPITSFIDTLEKNLIISWPTKASHGLKAKYLGLMKKPLGGV